MEVGREKTRSVGRLGYARFEYCGVACAEASNTVVFDRIVLFLLKVRDKMRERRTVRLSGVCMGVGLLL